MKVGDETGESIEIKQGMRKGCVVSPDFFSLYTQLAVLKLNESEGIKISGNIVNNIRYSDDMVLIADSEEKLQALISKLDEECRRMGLKINIGRSKAM